VTPSLIVKLKHGRVRGTNGTSPIPSLNRSQLARRNRLAARLAAQGWSPGLCRLAAARAA